MRLFFGVIFLLIGVLIVMGLYDISIFGTMIENLFYLWPFILIIIGISILSNIKGLRWLRYVSMIFIVIFALALIFYPFGLFDEDDYQEFPIRIGIQDPNREMIIKLNFPKIDLNVETDKTLTSEIRGSYHSNENDIEIISSGDRITISNEMDYRFYTFRKTRKRIRLKVPEDVNFELLVDTAALKADFLLEENPFSIIDINTAMLNMNMTVNRFKRPMHFISDSAIDNLDFIIPEQASINVENDSGIKKTTIDDQIGQNAVSPDLRLSLNSGISNLSIEGK